MTTTSKVWLIIGVSRGYVKSLTEAVIAAGDIVIGTTRDGKATIEDRAGRLHLLPLDVTDDAATGGAIARAQELHGRLDVIVNNAGYGLLGSVEEATEEEIDHLFEGNFHGTRRVVQAVLPYL